MTTYTFTPISPCFHNRAIARCEARDGRWWYIYSNGTCSCYHGESDAMCEHLAAWLEYDSHRIYPGRYYDFESLDGNHWQTAVTDDPDREAGRLAREWRLTDADEVIYAVAV